MKNLKTIKLFTLALAAMAFVSCSSNDDLEEIVEKIEEVIPEPLEVNLVTNFAAPQLGGRGAPESGEFAKFNLATGERVTSENEWDIAFRGTNVIINGGASSGLVDEPERTGEAAVYMATGILTTIEEIDTEALEQDHTEGFAIVTGSGNGWYSYDSTTHIISPIAGKIIAIRTHDGNYALVEIVSYYKDAPEDPNYMTSESRHYTFNYVYQPSGQITFNY
tara:strand:+ start:14696 stop:15358 length:663 start_codon:yes stop_codon:yes gene_type:complete